MTQSTYSTSTTNHPQQLNSNANVQFPKTATFASSTQTTTQKVIQPQQQNLQTNFGQPQSNAVPRQPWQNTSNINSNSSLSKTLTTLTDARSAPRRGRGLLQTQLSGGVIPFCGYCTQPIRYFPSLLLLLIISLTHYLYYLSFLQWSVHNGSQQDLVPEPLCVCKHSLQAISRREWFCGGTGPSLL